MTDVSLLSRLGDSSTRRKLDVLDIVIYRITHARACRRGEDRFVLFSSFDLFKGVKSCKPFVVIPIEEGMIAAPLLLYFLDFLFFFFFVLTVSPHEDKSTEYAVLTHSCARGCGEGFQQGVCSNGETLNGIRSDTPSDKNTMRRMLSR